MTSKRWTHLDAQGRASMVDVGGKATTRRQAEAECWVELSPSAFTALIEQNLAKGDAFAVARLAGIQAGKRTAEWIPLAHPLAVDRIGIELEPVAAESRVRIVASASTSGKTGVEMEAMVAAAAAALALYDMCKALDRGITIGPLQLLAKSGGRSGDWRRRARKA